MAQHGIVKIGVFKMAYKDKKTGKFISKEEWEKQNEDRDLSLWNTFVAMIIIGIGILYIGGI